MKEVLKLLENLPVSRPVFRVVKGSSWRGADVYELECLYPAGNACNAGDHVAELTIPSAQERFNRSEGIFEIDIQSSMDSVRYKIISYLQKFIEANSEAKNTYLTKIHKWWYDKANNIKNENFNEACLSLYKYLKTHEDASNPTHIKNGLSILEILMSKYGETNDTTQDHG